MYFCRGALINYNFPGKPNIKFSNELNIYKILIKKVEGKKDLT